MCLSVPTAVHVECACPSLGGPKSIMIHGATRSAAQSKSGPGLGVKGEAMTQRLQGLHSGAYGIVVIACS